MSDHNSSLVEPIFNTAGVLVGVMRNGVVIPAMASTLPAPATSGISSTTPASRGAYSNPPANTSILNDGEAARIAARREIKSTSKRGPPVAAGLLFQRSKKPKCSMGSSSKHISNLNR